MRERVTFIQPAGANFDPDALDVQPAGLVGPAARSARQDRLTMALDELSPELAGLLGGFSALHVRWASPLAYDTLEPLSSQLSAGLHVFGGTGLRDRDRRLQELCVFLQVFGALDCMSPEAFTVVDATSWSASSETFAFYQQLEDLSVLATSGTLKICPASDPICQSRLRSLYTATGLDLSMDAAQRVLIISAFWPLGEQALAVPGSDMRRTEVGIFGRQSTPNMRPFEVGLGGVTTVLGEQRGPSAVLFAFPSRHRQSEASFTADFQKPSGLHPSLQLRMSNSEPPAHCSKGALYAYLTLPRTVFADRYQLEDKLLLASRNLSSSRHPTQPVDLEAPEYATKSWGSYVLVELAAPAWDRRQGWTAQVPLHLRYLRPATSGYVQIQVPHPTVFWACEAEESIDWSTNPFDRMRLGYDDFFSPSTTFWHLTPVPVSGKRLVSQISVPVLRDEGSAWVRWGTTAVIGLGFVWVTYKLLAAFLGATPQAGRATRIRSTVKRRAEHDKSQLRIGPGHRRAHEAG